MSRDASVSFVWGDGEHTFRLRIGELRELQEKCGAGPPEILSRLHGGTWRVEDVIETLRLGLVGGGTRPEDAVRLVERYAHPPHLLASVIPAQAVLTAAIMGVPDEPLGKPEGRRAEGSRPSPPADGSASPSSTAPAPSSATRRNRSTQ